MIPVTIQCGCGQQYTFEVEPVAGRMPSAVSCPACGADGTDAANAAIANSASSPSEGPAPARSRLRVARPPTTDSQTEAPSKPPVRRASGLLPGQTNRTQAKIEARAKMLWGDTPLQVQAYLMGQGFEREEAAELVDELNRERAATIRGKGLLYIFGGIGCVCVPVVALGIFLALGYILVVTFLITIVVAFWGVWMIMKGSGMLLSAKSIAGNVEEQ